MEEQGCTLPPLSDFLRSADTNTPTSEPSPTLKDTPFIKAASSSQSLGRAGSDWAKPPSLLFTPTCTMSIDASFHGSRETTRPLEVDTCRQAVETAVPPATLPRFYHQQLHSAAYANSSLARASPAAQAPVMKLSNKRPRLPEDNALGGNGPVNNYSSSLVPAKKSNTRASQACDSCRQLKVKCDETKPCKSCKEKGHECKYGDPAPKTTNKAQASFSACIGQLDQRLTAVEAILTRYLATSEPKLEPSVEDEDGRAPVSSFATNDASTDPANFRSIATPVLERRPSSAPR